MKERDAIVCYDVSFQTYRKVSSLAVATLRPLFLRSSVVTDSTPQRERLDENHGLALTALLDAGLDGLIGAEWQRACGLSDGTFNRKRANLVDWNYVAQNGKRYVAAGKALVWRNKGAPDSATPPPSACESATGFSEKNNEFATNLHWANPHAA